MEQQETIVLCILAFAFAFGVASHICYFRLGEHHMYGAWYVVGFPAILIAGAAIDHYGRDYSVGRVTAETAAQGSAFLAGLYTSLAVYRLFLHPLRHFPGPVAYRLSDLAFSTQLGRRDSYRQVLALHERLGHFVRLGSNTLSITHPAAIAAVYGAGSPCGKAAWYDLTAPMRSMQTARDKTLHDARRRIWSPGFSDRALRGYEQRVNVYQDLLMERIGERARQGATVDISRLFGAFGFDVMGDLAFGRPFGMLESAGEERHWVIGLLKTGLEPLAFQLPVWLFRVVVAIPGATRDWWRFINYCITNTAARMRNKPDVPDIMSSLLKPYEHAEPTPADWQLLGGESQLIVVAGSDTTASTLTHIFYELGRHPSQAAKVRAEIAAAVDGPLAAGNGSGRSSKLSSDGLSARVQHQALQHLEHLNGVINETLRLFPPVPSHLQRQTPAEGLVIGDTFVPGDTTVFCPQYAMGRLGSIHARADEFIPERWRDGDGDGDSGEGKALMTAESRAAFAPFSAGPYGCIGRPLALMNIRTTVARIVLEYDVELAADGSAATFEKRSTDAFTLAPAELNVLFRRRAAVA